MHPTICILYKRGYAEPNDWSQPISTGSANEVMTIDVPVVSKDAIAPH